MTETIEQKAPKPPGLIPKQVQNYVILGVATLLILIIWLTSGNGKKPARHDLNTANTPDFSRLNQAKLEEYRNQLAAQERLLREQQALLLGQQPPAKADEVLASTPAMTSSRAAPAANPQEALKIQLQLEQQKKDYESLFANNLALSYRQESKQISDIEGFKEFLKAMGKNPASGGSGSLSGGSPSFPASAAPTVDPSTKIEGQRANEPRAAGGSVRVEDYSHSTGRQYRILAGTVLETVLLNRINSDFSGPVNCMVTVPIYSHDRQRVLIPEGSKILGEAQKVGALGQKRVAVTFHRLIMPDGFSITLDQFKGLNQIGETGLRDKVNNHYLQIFGMSVALGLISGFSNRGVTYYGPGTSGTDVYRAGVADSLSQSSQRILDRYTNILPTATIMEGHRVKVYLTNDLLLPDTMNHQMSADLSVERTSADKEENR